MLEDDVFRICRLCLKSGDWAIYVFNPKGTEGFLVWIIMKELVEISASRDDGLPCSICNECMKKLSDLKHFKFMCTNSRIEFLKFQINSGLVEHHEILEDDIFRMCRLCLKSGDWAIDVMDPKGTNGLLLWVIVKELVEIKVYQGDGLPHTICNECMRNLSKFKHFKTMCINSRIEFLKLQINSGLIVPCGKDGLACPGPTGKSIPERGNNWAPVNSEPGRNGGSRESEELPGICEDRESLRDPLCLDDVKSEVTVKSEESDEDDVLDKAPCCSEGDQNSESEVSVKVEKSNKEEDETFLRKDGDSREPEGSLERCGFRFSFKAGYVTIHGIEVESSGNEQDGAGNFVSEKGKEAVSEEDNMSRYTPSPFLAESNTVSNAASEPGGMDASRRRPQTARRGLGRDMSRGWGGSSLFFGQQKVREIFICVECGVSFLSKLTLSSHIRAHQSRIKATLAAKEGQGQENEDGTKYPCSNYEEVLGTYCDLDGEGFICVHCGKACARKAQLISHIRYHSGNHSRHVRIHDGKRPFQCEHCHKKFSLRSNLTTHMRTHDGMRPFQCELCNKKFSWSGHLSRHMRTHDGKRTFGCEVCNKKFSQSSTLKSHMRTHDGKRPFECEVCHKKFSQSSTLKSHMRTHDGKRPFECEVCHKKFSHSSNLRIHMRTHDGKRPFECEVCHKKFSQSSNLRSHMRTHDGKRPFECAVCNKKFSQRSTLSSHMRTHDGKRPFECELCHKKFSLSSHLSRHMRTHDGKRPFECELCHKKFSERGNLSKHMRTHDGKRPFECEGCHKKFSLSSHLSWHMRTHDGNRPFECELCHKTFSRRSNLSTHMRTHDGKRPFECELCHKKFSLKSTLSTHMRTHDGKRPFECEVCHKKFSHRSNLRTHMRTHDGKRPFECGLCHKKFSLRSTLSTHMRTHDGKRPFECEVCQKKFSQRSHLSRHMSTHDGKRPIECDGSKETSPGSISSAII